jgi:hypothetical protein
MPAKSSNRVSSKTTRRTTDRSINRKTDKVSNKMYVALNFSLVFIAVLLLLNLFDVQLPNLGHVFYSLDQSKDIILVEWEAELTECTDILRCCLEARKQSICRYDVRSETNWRCQTPGSAISYLMNNKAYQFCTGQPFWR